MRFWFIFWIVMFAGNFAWMLFAGFIEATNAQITSLAGIMISLFWLHREVRLRDEEE